MADSDIVQFGIAAPLGENTVGNFCLYFDGSDVGMNINGEDIDALEILDGKILISTRSSLSVPGISANVEYIVAFTWSTLGADTSGTWGLTLDDVDALGLP